MLDKQFTIISGSTCIVVLLMLLARTDAAPQVGEIDAMQETVTGATSYFPIYGVYQVRYYAKKRTIKCIYDVNSDECILEVGKRKECPIKLAKDQGPACKEPKGDTVIFNQVSPHHLEMKRLNINDKVPSSTKSAYIQSFTDSNGRIGGIAVIYSRSTTELQVYMGVVRK
eukprot:Nk52_evm1s2519 gene=Nk52_evmTU1s2519